MAGKKAHSKSTIKISEDIAKRALCLIDQIAKNDFFEFIKTFDLSAHFDEDLLVEKINQFLNDGEIGFAARAII